MTDVDSIIMELFLRFGLDAFDMNQLIEITEKYRLGWTPYSGIYRKGVESEKYRFDAFWWALDINKIEGIINGQKDKTH